VRIGEAQHLARDLLDEIGVRQVGAKERDIALELGAHGLEALDLELERALTLEQGIPRLEAVTALEHMKGEIGC